MARVARRKSKTGIYHIMLRGIDKPNIFLDDEIYSSKSSKSKDDKSCKRLSME